MQRSECVGLLMKVKGQQQIKNKNIRIVLKGGSDSLNPKNALLKKKSLSTYVSFSIMKSLPIPMVCSWPVICFGSVEPQCICTDKSKYRTAKHESRKGCTLLRAAGEEYSDC